MPGDSRQPKRGRVVPLADMVKFYFGLDQPSLEKTAKHFGLADGSAVRKKFSRNGIKRRTVSEGHRASRRKQFKRLSQVQVQECRLDPAYEAHHQIADYVICRECGVFSKSPLTAERGHLAVYHRELLPLSKYRMKFPNAPVYSAIHVAKHGETKGVPHLIANRAAAYVTAAHLLECRSNPKWESDRGGKNFIVCRKCGRRMRNPNVISHLRSHGYKSIGRYLSDFRDAPTVVPQQSKKQKLEHQKLCRLAQTHAKAKRQSKTRSARKSTLLGSS